MTSDPEIEDIRRENLERIATARRCTMIVEIDGRIEVHQHTPDSIAPSSAYNTPRQAVARVAQLLQAGPVAPQTWPETACIGEVSTEAPHDV